MKFDKEILKDFIITYDNYHDGIDIARKLVNLGFTISSYDDIITEINRWRCFKKGNRYDFTLALSSESRESINDFYPEIKHINYEEFYHIIKRVKIKKITNPTLDPYGEEDWGYEEEIIKENKNYCLNKRVKIKDNSKYKNQAYNNGGNGFGIIIDYNYSPGDFEFVIRWDNNHINLYRFKDIDILDDKKFKRITKPDIDPYGEEDWGYEEEIIKENMIMNYKRFINENKNNDIENDGELSSLKENNMTKSYIPDELIGVVDKESNWEECDKIQKKLQKLFLHKNVQFTSDRKYTYDICIDKNIKKYNIYVNNVTIIYSPAQNEYLMYFYTNNSEYHVVGDKPVTILDRIISKEDPYGEEEWD